MLKICNVCKEEKSISEFHKDKSKKDGYRGKCKKCQSEYIKQYYLDNKDIITDKNKIWRENNHDSIILRNKIWKSENPEKYKTIQKKYRDNNRGKIQKYQNEYNRNRKKNDPVYKLRCGLSRTITTTLSERKFNKKSKTCEILGCSFNELKEHLESQFEYWMTWDNHGNQNGNVLEPNKTWDIDHIIPMANAKTEEDVIRLNHYTNLQPLCSYLNQIIKKDNII